MRPAEVRAKPSFSDGRCRLLLKSARSSESTIWSNPEKPWHSRGRGAGFINQFIYLTLPHLARAITVVILIQTIFLLGIFGEIFTTTQGGPGNASTTLPYMIFKQAIVAKDIGRAAAGGIIAVVLANIVAIFLMRAVGKNLDR